MFPPSRDLLEAMLGLVLRVVFSNRAVLRAAVGADDAGGDDGVGGGRRSGGAVLGRRRPVHPLEAGGEGADSLETDLEADLGDGVVGVAEQRRRPLQAPGLQVDVGGLAEGAAELAAEVGLREPGGAGEILDLKRLVIARVGQVLGPEEMAGGRYESHELSLGSRSRDRDLRSRAGDLRGLAGDRAGGDRALRRAALVLAGAGRGSGGAVCGLLGDGADAGG